MAVPPAVAFEALSDASLRERAGDAVFRRGLAYERQGRAELQHERGAVACFVVTGSEPYEVQLQLGSGELQAACDCPHALDGNCCKHVVAAALHWRRLLGGDDPDAGGEGTVPDESRARRLAKAARTRDANAQALQEFLAARSAADLAARLWAQAQRDRDLMAELKGWAAAEAAAADPKALCRAVDALLKTDSRALLERPAARAWARRAQQALATLRKELPTRSAAVREAAELALKRCGEVMQRSVGEDEGLIGAYAGFGDCLVDALKAAPPPASWIEQLLRRAETDGDDIWRDPRLIDAAGPEAAAAFTRRLQARWKAAPAYPPGVEAYELLEHPRWRLRRLVIDDLDRHGDTPGSYEFQRASAVLPHEHAELIDWCELHGRMREALEAAQAACRLFPEDRALEDRLLRAYRRDGWDEEALALCRRRFERRGSPQDYAELVQAAQAARADVEALRHACLSQLEALEVAQLERERATLARYNPMRHVAQRRVSVRVAMLLAEGRLDEAIAVAASPNACEHSLLEILAARLDETRGAQAFALLRRCFDERMEHARAPYGEPLRLVAQASARLPAAEAARWQDELRTTWRSKPSFIAGLDRLQSPAPKRRRP